MSLDSVVTGRKAAAYLSGTEYKGNLRPDTEKEETGYSQISDENTRLITCTVCPAGCRIKAVKDDSGNWTFEGNKCTRGLDFSRSEVIDPVRVLTTTVLIGSSGDVVPVRSIKPVPLAAMSEIMEQIKELVVDHIPQQGEIVAEDLAGTGVGLKVTGSVDSDDNKS